MNSEEYRHDTIHYKVVELSTVTEETIESALNKWTIDGWRFDQIQFVVREASRRPSMAFMFFTKPVKIREIPSYEKTIEPTPDEDESNELIGYSNELIEYSGESTEVSDEAKGEIEWN